MARKRKVDNLLALAVLSTVHQRPMHRYEMASIMRAREKDQDMPIKWGSLYTVVQNMEKHGFLESIGSDRQGSRPERTIYQITDLGRAEMIDWTRDLIADLHAEQPRFSAGLSVLAALAPDDAIALLRGRLDGLTATIAEQRAARADAGTEIPRLFLVEVEYGIALLEAERAWLQSFVDELTSGTFDDLELWRTIHATEGMPEELAELAERGATDS